MHDESNQRWGKGSRFRVTSPNRQVDVALSIYLPKEETVFSTLSTLTAGLFTPFWVLTVCTVLFKTRPAPAHLRAGAGCVRLVLGAAGSCVPVVRAPAPFALLCLPFGDAQTSSDRQSCAFAALPGGLCGSPSQYRQQNGAAGDGKGDRDSSWIHPGKQQAPARVLPLATFFCATPRRRAGGKGHPLMASSGK
ncbi:uncharacterized protein LOC121232559 isoform X2 [Aquila chrysaetos chrysaetos]|uniref:uncharacterized protein LOC121232559 isoform X2 n=1 Tax=Aquila chrysaetos chrysaetos TaxID=223781 RepID=UPI001B7D3B9C|nr:uncharacterized protein LOC121232559 isoform X2 [Aquila chrysaetos chrysaetos]